jgi:TolB-like protein/DNA-binding winged helix-turn-helix (wHTH) protein
MSMRTVRRRFGRCELDVVGLRLLREGRPVKIQPQPLRMLLALTDRPGDIVTREELRALLWGDATFVEFDQGLGFCVRQIRLALGEEAARPVYVETIKGRGYRFIAPVIDEPGVAIVPAEIEGSKDQIPAPAAARVVPARALGAVDTTPVMPARRSRAALAIVAVAVGAMVTYLGWLRPTAAPRSAARKIGSIAVLPLANLSSDQSQEYFADGMTDELTTMLAKRTSLRVVSRTSAMHYKNTAQPLRDVARDLGADAIVEGSVAKTDTGMHLTMQLIDAASDTHLWADSFDRDLAGAYALSSALADRIAGAVGATTTPAADRQVSPEAHDAYLRGRYFWFSGKYDQSEQYMRKAVEASRNYALAWSGLADVYLARAVGGWTSADSVISEARMANAKALELDAALPEAHLTVAALHLFYDWDFTQADAEARHAIELNPSAAEPHHLRSYVLTALGRSSEALEEQTRATELDPFARPWALGFTLMHLRRFDAAIDELRLRSSARPSSRVSSYLSDCYRYKHMDREAAREMATVYRLNGAEDGPAAIMRAFESGGIRRVVEYDLGRAEALARTSYVSPLDLARGHGRLRQGAETLALLEAAMRERSPFLIFLQNEPDFDFLHGDPRYEAVVKQVGLPARAGN